MLQFKATLGTAGALCTLSGVPASTFAEVRFQNLSNGQSAVRVSESDGTGTASIDFPGFSRDHAVHVRILDNDETIYRLVYAAEQPEGALVLTEPAPVVPAVSFTQVAPPVGDEDLI